MKAYLKNIQADNFNLVKDGLYLHEITCDYLIGDELKQNVSRIYSPEEYKFMLMYGFIMVNSPNELDNGKWKTQIADIVQSSYTKTLDKFEIPIVDYLSYYDDTGVKELCHDIKNTDDIKRKQAIQIMADHLSK